MPQEMSFAQALTEARQIIVQQSNRIKSDLDKIKTMQETLAAQAGATADAERVVRQRSAELDAANEQIRALSVQVEELRIAKEQSEAVIDRQGQRLTQMQAIIADLEKQVADFSQKYQQASEELESIREHVPTQEDSDALAALSSLLSTKKGAPTPPRSEELAMAA